MKYQKLIISHIDKPTYELIEAERENEETIRRLKDDKFFNESPWRFNIIRQ